MHTIRDLMCLGPLVYIFEYMIKAHTHADLMYLGLFIPFINI